MPPGLGIDSASPLLRNASALSQGAAARENCSKKMARKWWLFCASMLCNGGAAYPHKVENLVKTLKN